MMLVWKERKQLNELIELSNEKIDVTGCNYYMSLPVSELITIKLTKRQFCCRLVKCFVSTKFTRKKSDPPNALALAFLGDLFLLGIFF